jgi:hypothetical protein
MAALVSQGEFYHQVNFPAIHLADRCYAIADAMMRVREGEAK